MLEPSNLFDPARYRRHRAPFPEARSLPAWCYTSPAFHRREVERIFLRSWLFVGRSEEIPGPGDYLCADTPGGPIVVLRDRERRIRAFANTCRHRGARLLKGTGRCERAIVCPYHGWTYALDGSLAGAAAMEHTVGFDRARYALAPLRAESWQGFIWISFDEAIEPLASHFGEMFERYASYDFADMVVTRRSDYVIECNWKLLIDIAHEDYHTTMVHRDSVGTQVCTTLETRGSWAILYLPNEGSIGVLPGETTSFPKVSGLAEALAAGTYFTHVYPNSCFGCIQDCMWWVTVTPLGPERCLNRVGFCFPRSTTERPDFEEMVAKYYRRWDRSIDEDNAAGELQQAGLRSALHEPGPYAHRERLVHRFARWVLDRVLDAPAPHCPEEELR